MSEIAVKTIERPIKLPTQELGAVACAGCPFVQLGCPKAGSGDCPPPAVIESKSARALLEDDSISNVQAGGDTYYGVPIKREQPTAPPAEKPKVVKVAPQPEIKKPFPKKPEIKRPKRQSVFEALAEMALSLLLPVPKAK